MKRDQDFLPHYPTNALEVSLLLAKLSATEDPYVYFSEIIPTFKTPGNQQVVYTITIVFGVLFGIVIVVCVLVIAYPLLQKSGSQGNDAWLFRRCHTTHSTSSMPYFVLNGGMFLAVCQFIGCIAFEAFIITSFLAYMYPSRMYEPYQAFLQISMWIPGFCGFFVSAFSASYVCISTAEEEPRFFFQRPECYNILLLLIPLYVTLQALGWAMADFMVVHRQLRAFSVLLVILGSASQKWKDHPKIDSDQLNRILKAFRTVNKLTCSRFGISRGATIAWIPFSFSLLIFYLYTIFSLFRLLQRSVRSTRYDIMKKSLNKRIPMSTIPHLSAPPNEAVMHIQRSYRFLLWHCVFMSFCIVWNAGVGLIFLLWVPQVVSDADRTSSSSWLLINESICLGGGAFLSIGMIFQSFRIMSEGRRKPIPEPDKHEDRA
ncbi:hypothetical protein CROQUDRAFT_662498 [Cronartium quercuum f. sp. fusiforme G11]|uniref:Uncharacterized protein n=1 Tax=Cronartium quercuum f. sp. fusiforme G11 TaxID=708437 RepID=A0A9P6NAQ7_9BASI|nr:hypothetical protein CROQUDRAFT_662498 [Cronartium quercuum f. sp. fusiforme G11]